MATESTLSRGRRILQLSLVSSSSVALPTTVDTVEQTGANDDTRISTIVDASSIRTNASSPTVDEMFGRPKHISRYIKNDENSSDSFQESIDSDDSLRDPHFTPTKHDLRKADLSTDDDDQIFQHSKRIKHSNTNTNLTPFVNVAANQNPLIHDGGAVLNVLKKTQAPLETLNPITHQNTVTDNDQNKDESQENTDHSIQLTNLDPDNTIASVDAEDDKVVENQILDHEEVVVTKTRAKRGRANTENWDRNIKKRLRMEGKVYKSSNSNIQKSRSVQPRKCTKACEADKRKQCNSMSEEDRQHMFESFWNMTWSEKKVLVSNLVERKDVEDRTTISPASSRRNYTYSYYLRRDGTRIHVCKNMFLTTLNIGEKTVYNWVDTTTKTAQVPRTKRARKGSVDKNSDLFQKAANFLDSLPKLPSHYCRSTSSKLYLEPVFSTFMSLYQLYTEHCRENNNPIMNRTSFKNIFDERNLSLFKPRKDQCDLCCSYEIGNVDNEQYEKHITRKNAARSEKARDKEAAISDDSLAVITVDVQAVLLCPSLQASALYYKTKLAVHNFTVYDLTTSDVTCYIWHEGEGDLSSNTFASFLTDYIKHLGKNIKTLIIYSDGCCYQNRNYTLSNALYKIAVEDNLTIYQKYLEKGHTQMEADSVHSTIERKLRKKPIYCPQQYVEYIKTARIVPRPYTVKYISHDFFGDYKKLNYYSSIRPGTKAGDPVVNDIRVMKYSPETDARIQYKLQYDDDFQELPRRAFVKFPCNEQIEKAYSSSLSIKPSKYTHLQELKPVIPADYHSFYDNLLH